MTAVSAKRLTILCEGQDDRAVIAELVKCSMLPDWCEPREPPRGATEGVEGVARALADRVDAGQRTVAMCDVDAATPEAAAKALLIRACAARPSVSFGDLTAERDARVFRGTGRGSNGEIEVAIVGVGAVGDTALAALGIETWAIDDYALRLVLERDAYLAFAKSEKYAEQDHAKVVHKANELRDLFRANGMPLRASKRYLHLLRGVIDFRGSAAMFAQHLVSRAARAIEKDRLRALLDPSLSDLEHAIAPPPAG